MSSSARLVIDNSVLSAFHTAGWFQSLSFWQQSFELATSRRIWDGEFEPKHALDDIPPWLHIESATLETTEAVAAGQLSQADWSCIALAEAVDHGQVVTNDQALHAIASDRECDVLWGTKFAIQTYEQCGISESDFESGQSLYIDDVLLPDAVITEIESAEKE